MNTGRGILNNLVGKGPKNLDYGPVLKNGAGVRPPDQARKGAFPRAWAESRVFKVRAITYDTCHPEAAAEGSRAAGRKARARQEDSSLRSERRGKNRGVKDKAR
ncbi:MAG TPA: hypothetical protein VH186_33550 [Chloroflexia bacterium]|nr:hypothetical protein [Chloroflexia bacterium]